MLAAIRLTISCNCSGTRDSTHNSPKTSMSGSRSSSLSRQYLALNDRIFRAILPSGGRRHPTTIFDCFPLSLLAATCLQGVVKHTSKPLLLSFLMGYLLEGDIADELKSLALQSYIYTWDGREEKKRVLQRKIKAPFYSFRRPSIDRLNIYKKCLLMINR